MMYTKVKSSPTSISWNNYNEMLSRHIILFKQMTRQNSSFHKFNSQTHQTLHTLLLKCTTLSQAKQIHAQLILHSLTNQTLTLSKLISFVALSIAHNIDYARRLFDQIPHPNKFIYNSLIRGYSNSENPFESLVLLKRMLNKGVLPNEYTLPFVLKACALLCDYWFLVVVHGEILKLGFGSCVFVQNGLINAYLGCGFAACARRIFDGMGCRSLVSWNSMICGYSKVGGLREAFLLFDEMRELGVEPDGYTFVGLLSVCANREEVNFGRFVHLYFVITGNKIDVVVRNALLDMYAKCGYLDSAERVFNKTPDKNVVSWTSMIGAYARLGLVESAREFFELMPKKNVVSWNSMISCYVQDGQYKEALDLFHEMSKSGMVANEATLLSVLSACGQIGDLAMGKKIHDYIFNNGIILSVTLCNSLTDMYAKCGALKTAVDVFSKMLTKNLVSWNVIIRAHALHGHGFEAIKLFDDMQAESIKPDGITFTGLLSACSHSGLVDMGCYYFDRMSSVYRVVHEIEHYACMVDLLGRGGLIAKAVRLIVDMPMRPDIVIWGALLGACRTQGNVELGKQIMKQLLELEPCSSGVYVLLANLFSEAQRWKDVNNIRKLINDQGIIKGKAISFIEIEGRVYKFMVDEKQHEFSGTIYTMLDQLTDYLKSIEFLSYMSGALSDIQEV